MCLGPNTKPARLLQVATAKTVAGQLSPNFINAGRLLQVRFHLSFAVKAIHSSGQSLEITVSFSYLQYRQILIFQIRNKHVAGGVGDDTGKRRGRCRQLGGDAAGPEHGDFA